MEDVLIPHHLPCLVLHRVVLLPTGFARISFSTKRSALLEHLSGGSGKDVFVAVIPDASSNSKDDAQDDDSPARALTQDKVGTVATAARVLQLARIVQGVCRVMVDEVMVSEDPEEEYDCVTVTQLELRPPGAPLPGKPTSALHGSPDITVSGAAACASNHGASDPVVADLGKQLKTTTRALLRQLSRSVGGVQTVRRILELLGSVPAWRAADVVAAALATGFQERLAVLRAVDHRQRVKLALAMAQSTLEAVRAGGPLGGPPGAGGSAAAWAGRAPLRLGRAGATSLPDDAVGGGRDAGSEDDPDGLDSIMARLTAAKPPPEVSKVAAKEYKRLRQSGENQPGYAAARAYLETLADLPWGRTSADAAATKLVAASTQDAATGQAAQGVSTAPSSASVEVVPLGAPLSLRSARLVLDRQHYGLDKVKDRVIEYLAVLRLKGHTAKAPILCFIGPPGVGKTSLARSVAEVLGRPFVRIALGGVRDEAEVRGHRRTYVGAMPGRIVNGLRRAAVNDPVMLLDELDKLGKDAVRGDPSAALLEVLDPEQNTHFTDAYLGLPCDLSRVTFVATANRAADIPAPLLDRLEVISLTGYTLDEKVHIAQCHLLPKALADHGLSADRVDLPDVVMEFITDRYTREAGVRALSRNLAALCRHLAVSIVSQHEADECLAGPSPSTAVAVSTPASTPAAVSSTLAAHRHHAVARAALARRALQASHIEHADSAHHNDDHHASHHQSITGALSLADVAEAPLDRFTQGRWLSIPQAAHASTSTMAPVHTHQPQQPLTAAAGRGSAPARRMAAPLTPPPLPHGGSTSTPTRTGWLFPWSNSSSSTNSIVGGMLKPDARRGRLHGSGNQEGVTRPPVECQTIPQSHPYPLYLQQQHDHITVTEQLVEEVLGPPRFNGSAEASEAVVLPGAAAGLVWTAVGGSVQYIECARIGYGTPGRQGTLTLTGQVGEVLEESARIALSWIRANAIELGLVGTPSHEPPVSVLGPGLQPSLLDHTEEGLDSEEGHGEVLTGRQKRAARLAAGQRDGDVNRSGADYHGNCGTFAKAGYTVMLSRQACHASTQPVATSAEANTTTAGTVQDLSQLTSTPTPHPIPRMLHFASMGASPALSWDIHVHLPAGAIPKDGPSAGITLAVALLSLLSGRVVRADTAMTGELSLRGLVLPVGGIKEKLLAARHAGLKRVIVPARNMRDVMADVAPAARAALTIIPAERLEQVLAAAFDPPFVLQPPPRLPSRL